MKKLFASIVALAAFAISSSAFAAASPRLSDSPPPIEGLQAAVNDYFAVSKSTSLASLDMMSKRYTEAMAPATDAHYGKLAALASATDAKKAGYFRFGNHASGQQMPSGLIIAGASNIGKSGGGTSNYTM
ncbi:MAG: hypothetical protein RI935_692 [Candidatus Parcubacteria bacterium]|jgi:hypothetical protein